MKEYEDSQKPTTIAVSSCVVKTYGGKQNTLYLSTIVTYTNTNHYITLYRPSIIKHSCYSLVLQPWHTRGKWDPISVSNSETLGEKNSINKQKQIVLWPLINLQVQHYVWTTNNTRYSVPAMCRHRTREAKEPCEISRSANRKSTTSPGINTRLYTYDKKTYQISKTKYLYRMFASLCLQLSITLAT